MHQPDLGHVPPVGERFSDDREFAPAQVEFGRRLAHPQSGPQYQVSPFVTMPRNYALQEIGGELRSIAATCASYRLRNVGTILKPGLRDDLQAWQLAAFSQDRCDPRTLTHRLRNVGDQSG